MPPSRPSPPTRPRRPACGSSSRPRRQQARQTPAAPRAVDGDRPPLVESGDAGADGLDPAGVLVAEGERRLPGHRAGRELVQHVQVGMADPGAAHPQEHLAGSRLGTVDLPELGVLLPAGQLQSTHGGLLYSVRRARNWPATSAAHARTASQSRKSPSGARMAVTIARSPTFSRSLSRRPANTWCPRAPTQLGQRVDVVRLVGRERRSPDRPAGEQPDRPLAQGRRVRAHPLAGRLPPPAGVHRAADQDGVEAGRGGRVLRLLEEDRQPDRPAVAPVGQLAGDRLGDPAGRTVLRRDDHQDARPRGRLGLPSCCSSSRTHPPFRTRSLDRKVPEGSPDRGLRTQRGRRRATAAPVRNGGCGQLVGGSSLPSSSSRSASSLVVWTAPSACSGGP